MKPTDKIQSDFERFHSDNPHVYAKLVEFARQVRDSGYRVYSIWALFARLRWHYDIDTKSNDGFKISNNHTSRYARLIMEQEPDLAGFFVTKQLASEPVAFMRSNAA